MSRSRLWTAVAALLTVLLPFGVSGEDSGATLAPGVLFSTLPPEEITHPVLWVSADHARFNGEGEVDLSLYRSAEQVAPVPGVVVETIEDVREGCTIQRVIQSRFVEIPEFKTVRDLATLAVTAISGEVVAVTPGFFAGHPMSLLSVQVETFSSRSVRDTPTFVYLVMQGAAFTVDGETHCGGMRAAPTVGSQIVTMMDGDPYDVGGVLLFKVTGRATVVEAPDGSIPIGHHLLSGQASETETISSLADLRRVVAAARSGGVE